MTKIDAKWFKMTKLTQNDAKSFKMTKKWCKMIQDEPKLHKMTKNVTNNSKKSTINQWSNLIQDNPKKVFEAPKRAKISNLRFGTFF